MRNICDIYHNKTDKNWIEKKNSETFISECTHVHMLWSSYQMHYIKTL